MKRIPWVMSVGALLLGACGQDAQPLETGELKLAWQVGPYGCEEAETDTVLISIFEDDEEEATTTLTQSCDARHADIAGVRPGVYAIHVEAVTDNGLVTFAGSIAEVQVRPGGVTEVPAIALAATPAELEVRWTFGGPFCSHVGAEFVEVMAFDAFGSLEQSIDADCNDGLSIMEIRPGDYDVVVQAQDEARSPTHEAIFEVELSCGERHIQQVSLED